MRRIGKDSRDVFRPRGRSPRELALAEAAPEAVVRILGERLTDERRRRIDEAVAHRTRRLTVAVEGVSDPHNTAAVIRTADAFGVQVVHIIEAGVRFASSRKVTQGAHKWVDLRIWREGSEFVRAARAEGKRVLVAAADGQIPLWELGVEEPLALVLGNEHDGVSAEVRRLAHGTFAIPMCGLVESFNVSVAAAIAVAWLRRDGQGDLTPEEAALLRALFYLRAVRAGCDIVERAMGGLPPGDGL